MLLVSCIPPTGMLMLIHYYVGSTVDTGKLKLSQLKRKSKKHYDFFSPPIIGIKQLHLKHFLESVCCLHTCFLCSEMENSISSGIPPCLKLPIRNTHPRAAASVSGVGKRALVCQCLAVRIPLTLTSLHLPKK